MFDEPEEERPQRRPSNPADAAKEKFDEFRMHAELAAVFEGPRKFDAEVLSDLDPETARECQKTIGRLEKSKVENTPVISDNAAPDADKLLDLPKTKDISTNDYHIYRRPGETMIMRWLAGDQVESFYKRLQAHFDAAMNQFKEEQRQAHGWKQDPQMTAFLEALDATDMKMADRYLRQVIAEHKLFILSTQSADEMDILHLTDFIMGVDAASVVGKASAPPDEPTERDRAWFFKLFSLRGVHEGEERMCFFAYLQKSDEF